MENEKQHDATVSRRGEDATAVSIVSRAILVSGACINEVAVLLRRQEVALASYDRV